MAKVLRGGKWGIVPRRANSNRRDTSSLTNTNNKVPRSERTNDANESIISFVEERGQMGVSIYDVTTNELFISKLSASENYAHASHIISNHDKTHIVLPATYRNNQALIDVVNNTAVPETPRSPINPSSAGPEQSTHDTAASSTATVHNSISYLPTTEFALGKAMQLCSLVSILGMPKNLNLMARSAYLSHITGDEKVIARSMGGLLSFLLQHGVLGISQADSDDIRINAIHNMNMCNVMRISSATQRSLHIFSYEVHPLGRGGLRGKEGLSLYGVLKSYVKTGAAKRLLRSWLNYPLTESAKIRTRQVLVQSMKESSNRPLLVTIKDALSGVKNVRGILGRLQRSCIDVNDWRALHSSSVSFIVILEALKAAVQQDEKLSQSALVQKAVGIGESNFRDTVGWIEGIVDFEESVTAGRMVVIEGFSAEIDELKRTYSGLDDFLTAIGMDELSEKLEKDGFIQFKSFQFKYQPQIGFLIEISIEECEEIGLDKLEESGMSFVFKSNDHGYNFKNKRCTELDDEIGDIHGAIMDLEAKAFRYLESKVFLNALALFEMTAVITELDCLQALAVAANEYSWTMPEIADEDNVLEIEDGRHPLVELTVSTFVPNSTRLRFGDVQILSGPNYSGKSVYLTQVALIAVLTQIGSCVPAKKARMALLDCVNGRISSFESVTHGQSSFFADASQVATMLVKRPGRPLNIIDEFGKGTSEVGGTTLLASVIHELSNKAKEEAAITICATHFVEILREPFLPLSNPRIGLFSMEIMVNPEPILEANETRNESQQDVREDASSSRPSKRGKTLSSYANLRDGKLKGASNGGGVVRTFRLLPGSICDESRALQCALEVGAPKFLLRRAAHVHSAISSSENIDEWVATEQNNTRMKLVSREIREFLKAKFEDQ